MILGTASYLSPEQARGKPVDRRADVWAFGCCLVCLFHDVQSPYEPLRGQNDIGEDLIKRVERGALQPKLDPERCSAVVAQVVDSSCNSAPEKRPTARVLLTMLGLCDPADLAHSWP